MSESLGVGGLGTSEFRHKLASACRILASKGLVQGVLGHVSSRMGPDHYLIRCRGPYEQGLGHTSPDDIQPIDSAGRLLTDAGADARWSVPKEYPIHTVLYRDRPEVGAVIHAHPPSALLVGLAGLKPRPVFGAYNIPAMRMAVAELPVYQRSVLIAREELAEEMLRAMGASRVCLLKGHGITVAAPTVEAAVVAAVNLNELLAVTVELARLGADVPDIPIEDLAELPDLGSEFNETLAWRALLAEVEG